VSAAIATVDPARLVAAALGADRPADLPAGSPVVILAVGKAAPAMARACLEHSGSEVRGGLVVSPRAVEGPSTLAWRQSSHPVPDGRSVDAARAALDLVRSVYDGDAVLVLLSGGASALMALPAEGLSLDAKQVVTRRLLAASASIHEVNCVRKHLSAIKGGRLAAEARARVITLALSDVVGDDPSVIGSGPTVPDPSTYAEALGILERCGGLAAYPPEVAARLRSGAAGEIAETPKPGEPAFARGSYRVIGSGVDAARGAAAAAERAGYRAMVLPRAIVGEARFAASRWFDDVARLAASHDGPLCIVSCGETTVDVRGAGRGGRNQEFALAVAGSLVNVDRPAVIASVGTDGVDGPTDAAGAVADSTTSERAAALGLDPLRYLEANDSWSFFEALGDLVRTGPTGTNVGDVQVALLGHRGGAGRR
jgi:hydroxypyruvate reductase